jgi:GABA(A) receptor-associated protein
MKKSYYYQKPSNLSISQIIDNVQDKVKSNFNSLHHTINEKIIEKSNLQSSFKYKHNFEKRLQESTRIKEKYPDRYPIICERGRGADLPSIDRKKYLVPGDLNIANFMYIIRKRIKLSPEKSIFLFFGETQMLPSTTLITQAYENHKDEDGFLYVQYNGESTFG